MPLSVETDGGVRSSFIHCVSICDRDFPEEDSDSSSSSSIGRNSDSSEDSSSDREDSGETEEVQSSFKGPLDTINDLEEDLPVKKGISKYYNGKSKSFTSLADAAIASSMQEIVKPEDPYAKKRKNLLARNILIDRSRSYLDNIGGISKKPANIGRGTSCLTLSILSSSNGSSSEEGKSSSSSVSPPCPLQLPPLHPQHAKSKRTSEKESLPCPPTRNNAPWRSYSWSDLQSVGSTEAHDMSSLAICSGNKGNKVH